MSDAGCPPYDIPMWAILHFMRDVGIPSLVLCVLVTFCVWSGWSRRRH